MWHDFEEYIGDKKWQKSLTLKEFACREQNAPFNPASALRQHDLQDSKEEPASRPEL